MTFDEYQREAMRTAPSFSDASESLLNGLMGLCGESGECVDLLKKARFQGHPMDVEHMAKELGDVAWYLANSANAIGYSLEDICKLNVKKLRNRYPDGFEVKRSVNRDKNDI